MSRPGGFGGSNRRLPRGKRKPTPEGLTKWGSSLHDQILYWLTALEVYDNWTSVPKRPLTVTYCNGGGGEHWQHVRVMPFGRQRKTHVAVAAPRDKYPHATLAAKVINPLREKGYEITDAKYHRSCGCTTFIVRPRKVASK